MADETQIAKAEKPIANLPEYLPELGTGMSIVQMAKTISESGLFTKGNTIQQCVVKMMIGKELGLGPIQALQNIDVFDGNISLRSNMRAACIKARKGYNYRVVEWTDQKCTIDFTVNGESVGTYTYTMADATRAKLNSKNNWQTHPKAMLFARAMSAGQRAFMPEAMMGLIVYEQDEMEEIKAKPTSHSTAASVNAALSGAPVPEVIEAEVRDVPPEPAAGPGWQHTTDDELKDLFPDEPEKPA